MFDALVEEVTKRIEATEGIERPSTRTTFYLKIIFNIFMPSV